MHVKKANTRILEATLGGCNEGVFPELPPENSAENHIYPARLVKNGASSVNFLAMVCLAGYRRRGGWVPGYQSFKLLESQGASKEEGCRVLVVRNLQVTRTS